MADSTLPTIRDASEDDIPFMMILDQQCPTAAHWSRLQYEEIFKPERFRERMVLVAEAASDSGLVLPQARDKRLGFLVAGHLAPEWELENIIVAPLARRQGLGKRLLDHLLTSALNTNSTALFLEVRESNAAARALYEKAGFQRTGCRKRYYADSQEDAILYRRVLS